MLRFLAKFSFKIEFHQSGCKGNTKNEIPNFFILKFDYQLTHLIYFLQKEKNKNIMLLGLATRQFLRQIGSICYE